MKKVYTRDGGVFFLNRKLDGKTSLVANSFEEVDYEGNSETVPSDTFRIMRTDQLFDEPPTALIATEVAKEIERLNEVQGIIREEIRKVNPLRKEIEVLTAERDRLLAKAGLSQLNLFINGGITHYVDVGKWRSPRILAFSDTVSEHSNGESGLGKMRLLTLYGKSNGDLEWRLNQYSDGSSFNDITVIPCTSLEEAQRVLREQIVLRMETTVNDELFKCATDAGVDIPVDWQEKLAKQKRDQAQKKVDDAQKKLDAAKEELAAI